MVLYTKNKNNLINKVCKVNNSLKIKGWEKTIKRTGNKNINI